MTLTVPSTTLTDPLVSIDHVRKSYRTASGIVQALSSVSVDIDEGEFVSVVGPSGCGKSTLMRIVAGLDRPSAGEVSLAGSPVSGPSQRTGIVFQEATLLPWRNALENVLLPLEIQRVPRTERLSMQDHATELLHLVGLAGFERAYPNELSGGMQQRVSLARALLMDPSLLLMDEPFGALDALTREQMNLELLRIWSETRKTVIFISHSVPETVILSDRVLVMSPRPGRISGVVKIDLPRPRSLHQLESPAGVAAIAQVRGALDDQQMEASAL